MKNFLLILVMIIFCYSSEASKIYNDTLSLGVTGSTNNKDINFGQTPNGVLRWNHGSNKFQFSNNGGSNFYDFQQYIDNLTSGRVLFGSATGTIGQSGNLLWDNLNSRLGIGVSPSYELDVNGTGNFTTLKSGTDVQSDTNGVQIKNQKQLRLYETTANGTDYLSLKAPASLTTTTNFTLPDGDGNANQALLTDGSGTLRWGDAGGGIGVNYITNYNAEVNTTGWAAYKDAAQSTPVDGTSGSPSITWTRVTSPILTGTASFKYTKPASNVQGEGVSYDYTITSAHYAEAQMIRMYYQTDSNYVEDCLGVFVYDKTNSQLIQPQPYLIKKSSLTEHPFFEFQNSSNATDYRFIIHNVCTSSTAFNVYFDDVQIGPKTSSKNSTITDWISYTPTGSWVTNTSYVGKYRVNGDSIDIDVTISTSGVPDVGALTFKMPTGYVIDTSKLSDTNLSNYNLLGHTSLFDAGATGSYTSSVLGLATTTDLLPTYDKGDMNLSNINYNLPFSFGAGDKVRVRAFGIPIVGRSSGTQIADIYTGRRISFSAPIGSGNHTSSGSSQTVTTWGTTTIDDVGGWDSGTGTYTFKSSGTYRIDVLGAFNANATGYRYWNIRVNNTTNYSVGYSSGSTNLITGGSLILPFSVGDTLVLQAFQNTGGNLAYSPEGRLSISRLDSPNQILASEKVVDIFESNSGAAYTNGNVLVYEDKVTSTHGSYNSSTGVYTCLKGGFLSIVGTIDGTVPSASAGLYVYVRKNSADYKIMSENRGTASSGTLYKHFSGKYPCVYGDTFTVNIATDVTFSSLSNTFYNHISFTLE